MDEGFRAVKRRMSMIWFVVGGARGAVNRPVGLLGFARLELRDSSWMRVKIVLIS